MDLIRDILIQHDIKPPTGAVRKQELVDMFNLHIKPQVAKLREAHQSVVPTEEGIIKVPKGKGTIMELYDGDNDDSDSLPPRSAKATRSKSFQPVVEVKVLERSDCSIFKKGQKDSAMPSNIFSSYFRSPRFRQWQKQSAATVASRLRRVILNPRTPEAGSRANQASKVIPTTPRDLHPVLAKRYRQAYATRTINKKKRMSILTDLFHNKIIVRRQKEGKEE